MDVDRLVRRGSSDGSFRVSHRAYVDPDVLARERAMIFDRCWLYAGHESEIPAPGCYRRVELAGRPAVLVRDQDGAVRVFLNSCPHRGAMFCREPRGQARAFQCPYHLWTFDTRGALTGVPGGDAYPSAFDRAELGLPTPAGVASYRGFVFATFAKDAAPLVDYLAGAREYLDLICDQSVDGFEVVPGTQRYTLHANWKLLAENTLDGYHLDKLHRRVYGYYASQGVAPLTRTGRAVVLGNGHAALEITPPVRRLIAHWGPPWGEDLRAIIETRRAELERRHGAERAFKMTQSNRILYVFPSLLILDGESGNVWLRAFAPEDAPGRTSVSMAVLAPRGESARERAIRMEDAIAFSGPGGFATPDDVEILETCQRAFRDDGWSDDSRGPDGAAAPLDGEAQMRALWRHWSSLLRESVS